MRRIVLVLAAVPAAAGEPAVRSAHSQRTEAASCGDGDRLRARFGHGGRAKERRFDRRRAVVPVRRWRCFWPVRIRGRQAAGRLCVRPIRGGSKRPVAAMGIGIALGSGMVAARVAAAALEGNPVFAAAYGESVARIYGEYRRRLRGIYAAEEGWKEEPFWERRNRVV